MERFNAAEMANKPAVKKAELARLFVKVAARSAKDNGDGTFDIELRGVPITAEDSAVIQKLFPTFEDDVLEFLAKEALLKAMI